MAEVESQRVTLEEKVSNESLAKNNLIKKEEESTAIEAQLELENKKALDTENKITNLICEHGNLMSEMQNTSYKLSKLLGDFQLQSELPILKMKLLESEKLEEKLSTQVLGIYPV